MNIFDENLNGDININVDKLDEWRINKVVF